jgi:hypothetical protein
MLFVSTAEDFANPLGELVSTEHPPGHSTGIEADTSLCRTRRESEATLRCYRKIFIG